MSPVLGMCFKYVPPGVLPQPTGRHLGELPDIPAKQRPVLHETAGDALVVGPTLGVLYGSRTRSWYRTVGSRTLGALLRGRLGANLPLTGLDGRRARAGQHDLRRATLTVADLERSPTRVRGCYDITAPTPTSPKKK